MYLDLDVKVQIMVCDNYVKEACIYFVFAAPVKKASKTSAKQIKLVLYYYQDTVCSTLTLKTGSM